MMKKAVVAATVAAFMWLTFDVVSEPQGSICNEYDYSCDDKVREDWPW